MSDQNIPVTADASVEINCDNNNSEDQKIVFSHDAGDDYEELMRIQENGNVGIGTAAPPSKLTIKNTADCSSLSVQSSYAGNNKIFEITQEGLDGYLYLRAANNTTVTKLSGYGLTPSFFMSDVGIGTTEPAHTLELKTTETEDGIYAYYGANNHKAYSLACAEGMGNFASNLEMFPPTSGFANPLVKLQAHNSGGGTMSLKNSGGTTTVHIASDGNSYFNGGKVGIGTTDPQSKLHIDGNITAAGAGAGITSGIKTTMTLNTSQGCDGLFAVSINPVFNDDYNIDNVGCLNIQPTGAMVNYGIRMVMPYGLAGNSNCGIKVEQPDLQLNDPQYGIYAATGIYAVVGEGGKGRAIWGNAYSNQGGIGGYFEALSGSYALKAKGKSIFSGYLKIGNDLLTDPTERLDVNGNIKTSGYVDVNGPRILSGSVNPASSGVAAPKGSIYMRTNGGSGSTIYAKHGSGDTDWSALS